MGGLYVIKPISNQFRGGSPLPAPKESARVPKPATRGVTIAHVSYAIKNRTPK
jgi:hypothetical protein